MTTVKERLKEAIDKYPIGTVVLSLGGAGEVAITGDIRIYYDNVQIIATTYKGVCTLYMDKKWADIISYPEEYKLLYQIFN